MAQEFREENEKRYHRCCFNLGDCAFTVAAPTLWNSACNLHDIYTVDTFKKQLQGDLLRFLYSLQAVVVFFSVCVSVIFVSKILCDPLPLKGPNLVKTIIRLKK